MDQPFLSRILPFAPDRNKKLTHFKYSSSLKANLAANNKAVFP